MKFVDVIKGIFTGAFCKCTVTDIGVRITIVGGCIQFGIRKQAGQKLQKCFAGAKWTCIFNKNGNIYKRFCQGMYILTKEP